MTNEAKLILQWADQYRNCAVNHVPKEVALELSLGAYDRVYVEHYMTQVHLRFENGIVGSINDAPYDDRWSWPPLDACVDYGILIVDPVIDIDLDVDVSLSEVL